MGRPLASGDTDDKRFDGRQKTAARSKTRLSRPSSGRLSKQSARVFFSIDCVAAAAAAISRRAQVKVMPKANDGPPLTRLLRAPLSRQARAQKTGSGRERSPAACGRPEVMRRSRCVGGVGGGGGQVDASEGQTNERTDAMLSFVRNYSNTY